MFNTTQRLSWFSSLATAAILGIMTLLSGCGGGAASTTNTTTTTALALYTTAPGTITIPVGGLPTTYTIGGGTAPYTATSSNASVVQTSISGTTVLNVTGMAVGTASVDVRDAAGAKVTISVNVQEGVKANLFTTSPSAITVPVGGLPTTYTIGGGTAPYTATSSNASLVQTSVSGTTVLNVTGMAVGTASVDVRDATGAIVTISVDVQGGVIADLFTTSPPAITIAAIGGAQTYTIGGGTMPYVATSTNTHVATASVAGTALIITGISDGLATIVVRDASGTASVSIAVNVATGKGFTVIAPATTWTVSAANPTDTDLTNDCPGGVPVYSVYFINGGFPPYTVSSSAPLIAAVLAASPTGAQTAQAAGTSVTVGLGGYFVAAWINNPCFATGMASFRVIDSTGTILDPAPTFTVTWKPS